MFRLKRIFMREVTLGVLLDEEGPFAVTLEDKWNNNEIETSCIPPVPGNVPRIYECHLVQSPKFGKVYEILRVPNRSHILLHRGNTEFDTSGCILVAEKFEELQGLPAIQESEAGFNEFMLRTGGKLNVELEIGWYL